MIRMQRYQHGVGVGFMKTVSRPGEGGSGSPGGRLTPKRLLWEFRKDGPERVDEVGTCQNQKVLNIHEGLSALDGVPN